MNNTNQESTRQPSAHGWGTLLYATASALLPYAGAVILLLAGQGG